MAKAELHEFDKYHAGIEPSVDKAFTAATECVKQITPKDQPSPALPFRRVGSEVIGK